LANTSPLQSEKAKCRRALLIESSTTTNTPLAELFDPSIWTVSYANDNESAIEMAKGAAFDLILTNAATTCAEDTPVLQRLRAVRPHTRVIILTEEWLPGDILKAIRNHAFSYFTLPIAKSDLRKLIEQALKEPVWDDGIELIQGNAEHVVLAVRCDLATLERLIHFMRESLPLPAVECEEVAFAFREVLLNAMEHGGRFDPREYVEVCYLKSKRMIMCRVKDPGEGFSMQEIRDAETAEPLEKYAQQVKTQSWEKMETPPRGLGILMARKFLDDLIFSEKGNEAFLVKYLPQRDLSKGAGNE
jgi:CheY-like chemotaxis protein/anti-sigma regulatory factor (Ser/Thr protein kinase)